MFGGTSNFGMSSNGGAANNGPLLGGGSSSTNPFPGGGGGGAGGGAGGRGLFSGSGSGSGGLFSGAGAGGSFGSSGGTAAGNSSLFSVGGGNTAGNSSLFNGGGGNTSGSGGSGGRGLFSGAGGNAGGTGLPSSASGIGGDSTGNSSGGAGLFNGGAGGNSAGFNGMLPTGGGSSNPLNCSFGAPRKSRNPRPIQTGSLSAQRPRGGSRSGHMPRVDFAGSRSPDVLGQGGGDAPMSGGRGQGGGGSGRPRGRGQFSYNNARGDGGNGGDPQHGDAPWRGNSRGGRGGRSRGNISARGSSRYGRGRGASQSSSSSGGNSANWQQQQQQQPDQPPPPYTDDDGGNSNGGGDSGVWQRGQGASRGSGSGRSRGRGRGMSRGGRGASRGGRGDGGGGGGSQSSNERPPLVCKYALSGSCNNGNACSFYHATDAEQNAHMQRLNLQQLNDDNRACRFFYNTGSCRHGDACTFWHLAKKDRVFRPKTERREGVRIADRMMARRSGGAPQRRQPSNDRGVGDIPGFDGGEGNEDVEGQDHGQMGEDAKQDAGEDTERFLNSSGQPVRSEDADDDAPSMHKSVTPRCMAMAYDEEFKSRINDGNVSFFEATAETRMRRSGRKPDRTLVVTKFHRSVPGALPKPEEVRPPAVTLQTVYHLLLNVMTYRSDTIKRIHAYDFVEDRLRALRSDFVRLHAQTAHDDPALLNTYAHCIEICGRFWAAFQYEMCDSNPPGYAAGFDTTYASDRHSQQMMHVSGILKDLYNIHPLKFKNEAFITSLRMLMRAGGVGQDFFNQNLKGHPMIKMASFFCVMVNAALKDYHEPEYTDEENEFCKWRQRYRRFFDEMRDSKDVTYLHACLLYKYFPMMRTIRFWQIVQHCLQKRMNMPHMENLIDLLLFDTAADAVAFFDVMGYSVRGYDPQTYAYDPTKRHRLVKARAEHDDDIVKEWFADHDQLRGTAYYDRKTARRVIDKRLGCDGKTPPRERAKRVVDAIIGEISYVPDDMYKHIKNQAFDYDNPRSPPLKILAVYGTASQLGPSSSSSSASSRAPGIGVGVGISPSGPRTPPTSSRMGMGIGIGGPSTPTPATGRLGGSMMGRPLMPVNPLANLGSSSSRTPSPFQNSVLNPPTQLSNPPPKRKSLFSQPLPPNVANVSLQDLMNNTPPPPATNPPPSQATPFSSNTQSASQPSTLSSMFNKPLAANPLGTGGDKDKNESKGSATVPAFGAFGLGRADSGLGTSSTSLGAQPRLPGFGTSGLHLRGNIPGGDSTSGLGLPGATSGNFASGPSGPSINFSGLPGAGIANAMPSDPKPAADTRPAGGMFGNLNGSSVFTGVSTGQPAVPSPGPSIAAAGAQSGPNTSTSSLNLDISATTEQKSSLFQTPPVFGNQPNSADATESKSDSPPTPALPAALSASSNGTVATSPSGPGSTALVIPSASSSSSNGRAPASPGAVVPFGKREVTSPPETPRVTLPPNGKSALTAYNGGDNDSPVASPPVPRLPPPLPHDQDRGEELFARLRRVWPKAPKSLYFNEFLGRWNLDTLETDVQQQENAVEEQDAIADAQLERQREEERMLKEARAQARREKLARAALEREESRRKRRREENLVASHEQRKKTNADALDVMTERLVQRQRADRRNKLARKALRVWQKYSQRQKELRAITAKVKTLRKRRFFNRWRVAMDPFALDDDARSSVAARMAKFVNYRNNFVTKKRRGSSTQLGSARDKRRRQQSQAGRASSRYSEVANRVFNMVIHRNGGYVRSVLKRNFRDVHLWFRLLFCPPVPVTVENRKGVFPFEAMESIWAASWLQQHLALNEYKTETQKRDRVRFSIHMSAVMPGDEEFAAPGDDAACGAERQYLSGIAFVTSLVKLVSKDDRLLANLDVDAVRLRALLRRYLGSADQARDLAVPLVLFVPVAIDPATANSVPLVGLKNLALIVYNQLNITGHSGLIAEYPKIFNDQMLTLQPIFVDATSHNNVMVFDELPECRWYQPPQISVSLALKKVCELSPRFPTVHPFNFMDEVLRLVTHVEATWRAENPSEAEYPLPNLVHSYNSAVKAISQFYKEEHRAVDDEKLSDESSAVLRVWPPRDGPQMRWRQTPDGSVPSFSPSESLEFDLSDDTPHGSSRLPLPVRDWTYSDHAQKSAFSDDVSQATRKASVPPGDWCRPEARAYILRVLDTAPLPPLPVEYLDECRRRGAAKVVCEYLRQVKSASAFFDKDEESPSYVSSLLTAVKIDPVLSPPTNVPPPSSEDVAHRVNTVLRRLVFRHVESLQGWLPQSVFSLGRVVTDVFKAPPLPEARRGGDDGFDDLGPSWMSPDSSRSRRGSRRRSRSASYSLASSQIGSPTTTSKRRLGSVPPLEEGPSRHSPATASSSLKRRRLSDASLLDGGGFPTPFSGAAQAPSGSSARQAPAGGGRGLSSLLSSRRSEDGARTPAGGFFAVPADSSLGASAVAGSSMRSSATPGGFFDVPPDSSLGSATGTPTISGGGFFGVPAESSLGGAGAVSSLLSANRTQPPKLESSHPTPSSAPRGLTSLLSRSFASPRSPSVSEPARNTPHIPDTTPRGLTSLLTGRSRGAPSQLSSHKAANGASASPSFSSSSQAAVGAAPLSFAEDEMKGFGGGLPPLQGAVAHKPGKQEVGDDDFPAPKGVVAAPMSSRGGGGAMNGAAGSRPTLAPMNGHSRDDAVVL